MWETKAPRRHQEVICFSRSMDGGNVYPFMVRKDPNRNIRMWMSDGADDLSMRRWGFEYLRFGSKLTLSPDIASVSRSMDLSALESAVKPLERSLDSIEGWLTVSTVLVVVGLVIEYWYPFVGLIKSIRKSPPFPWKLLMEMIGGMLVTVGVVGELWFQSRASKIETFIRSDSHQIEALLNKEAADASREAAEANRTAASDKLARVQLEARLADRVLIAPDRFLAELTPLAGTAIDVFVFGSTPEIFNISHSIMGSLQRSHWVIHSMVGRRRGWREES
jgi:hypothetical protein